MGGNDDCYENDYYEIEQGKCKQLLLPGKRGFLSWLLLLDILYCQEPSYCTDFWDLVVFKVAFPNMD